MAPHYDTAMMEGLSRTYVRAVTVRAGCRYTDIWERDIGTDAQIDYIDWIDGKPRDMGKPLRLQIKATSQDSKHTPTEVILDIQVDHYRKLIELSPGVQIILIAFDMPNDDKRWLHAEPDGLVMRNCAYWQSLEGMEKVPNAATVSVKIRERRDSMSTQCRARCGVSPTKRTWYPTRGARVRESVRTGHCRQ